MKLPISLRILNSFAVALFGAFAVFQYNDIDPAVYHRASSLDAALWLSFYALVSVLFALTLIRRSASPWLLLVGAIACLATSTAWLTAPFTAAMVWLRLVSVLLLRPPLLLPLVARVAVTLGKKVPAWL